MTNGSAAALSERELVNEGRILDATNQVKDFLVGCQITLLLSDCGRRNPRGKIGRGRRGLTFGHPDCLLVQLQDFCRSTLAVRHLDQLPLPLRAALPSLVLLHGAIFSIRSYETRPTRFKVGSGPLPADPRNQLARSPGGGLPWFSVLWTPLQGLRERIWFGALSGFPLPQAPHDHSLRLPIVPSTPSTLLTRQLVGCFCSTRMMYRGMMPHPIRGGHHASWTAVPAAVIIVPKTRIPRRNARPTPGDAPNRRSIIVLPSALAITNEVPQGR